MRLNLLQWHLSLGGGVVAELYKMYLKYCIGAVRLLGGGESRSLLPK